MTLTPETIEKLRKANMANLVKKLQSGKTLTAAESKLIDLAARGGDATGERVTTTKLAEIFRVSLRSIKKWRTDKRDGIPERIDGLEDVKAWREWFAAHPEAGYSNGKARPDRETLLCQKLEIEIAIKAIELDEATGELVSQSEVDEGLAAIGATIKAALQKMQNDLPPILEGLDAISIQASIRKHNETILETFASEVSRRLNRKGDERILPNVQKVQPTKALAVGGKPRPDSKQRKRIKV